MADNYVSLRIKATDEAKPDLADLKAKLDELSHKVATARAQVDDKEADAALAAFDVKLRRIAGKVVDPKIKVAGAERALADLLAVDVAMDRMNRKAADLKLKADAEAASGGLLGRLMFGKGGSGSSFWSSLLGGAKKPFNLIPGVNLGGAGGGAGEAGGGGLLDSVGSIAGTLGAAIPVVAALLVELDGLVSGFAAAGAGAGAFGLLAMPAIKSVTSEYQKLNAVNQKYQQAVALEKLDPTKAHAAAVKAALDQVNLLGQAYQKLPVDEQKSVDGIFKLTRTFQSMSKAFEPEAFKVFAGVLKIANELLPHITPFARTFADAVSGLLGQAGKFADSKGFKDWLSQFQKLEGPSITAIGTGIGHVVASLGKLLTIMSAKDVVNSINIAFSVLDGIVLGFVWTIRNVMHWWDTLTHQFDESRHYIGHTFDSVRHGAAEMGHDVAVWFDRLRHDVSAAVDGTVKWVGAHWRVIAALLLDPVVAVPGEIHKHWRQIVHEFDAGRHAAVAILDGLRHAAARVFDAIRHEGAALIASAWHAILGETARGAASTVSFFHSLPGRITGALAALPGLLFRAGQNAIGGLIRGIGSMIGTAISTVTGWGHDIANAIVHPFGIHFSEPSEAAQMIKAGRNVSLGLAKGMTGARGAVEQAARTVGAAGLPHGGYGHGGGKLDITLTMGPGSLLKAMQAEVRTAGGDPAMFQRKVAYR